jgi:hypothetical protein
MHVDLFAKIESLTQGSSIKCATLVSNKVMMCNMDLPNPITHKKVSSALLEESLVSRRFHRDNYHRGRMIKITPSEAPPPPHDKLPI